MYCCMLRCVPPPAAGGPWNATNLTGCARTLLHAHYALKHKARARPADSPLLPLPCPAAGAVLMPGSGCSPQGLSCDLPSSGSAARLTYTGEGLKYQGQPLVQVPSSRLLVTSAVAACLTPGSGNFSFVPAKNGACGGHRQRGLLYRGCS